MRNDYLLECLEARKVAELPEEQDIDAPFSKGIALIKRDTGLLDYVLISKKDGRIRYTKDFGFGMIKELIKVYPTNIRVKTEYEKSVDITTLDTISKCKYFLNKVAEESGDEALAKKVKATKKLDDLKNLINNL